MKFCIKILTFLSHAVNGEKPEPRFLWKSDRGVIHSRPGGGVLKHGAELRQAFLCKIKFRRGVVESAMEISEMNSSGPTVAIRVISSRLTNPAISDQRGYSGAFAPLCPLPSNSRLRATNAVAIGCA